MGNDQKQLLNSKVLSRISRLEIRAKGIVEGYITGLHKSPYHGFSVEFAEHREYVPGDDIKHIDWKVFGRSDRFYIKQYEEETNLISHIIVDTSESMHYGRPTTKLAYASELAACLAYLIIRQQDAVSLLTFDEDIQKYLPPSSNPGHLRYICAALLETEEGKKTNLGVILHKVAEKIKKRGLVILISDMFDQVENILFGLRHLRHKGHEVLLFHVLDKDEVSFPFEDLTMFEGMEGYQDLLANPKAVRQSYLEELQRFCEELKNGCMRNRIDYTRLDTSQDLSIALSSYLAARIGKARR
ncbi:MAG: DUF58 domain-containing protein [Planctomycetota bacterium]|nr:MAG: DUF58 domain-containing protein [Planctomycetota bacterium]